MTCFLSKTVFNDYLQGFHILLFRKISRYIISDSKKDTSANLDAVWQKLFQKTPPQISFRSLVNFFRIHIKNYSWWIAQKILSKKFKRRVGGTGAAKRTQSESLRKLYGRHFQDMLSEFCFNGVSVDRWQLL